jgi:Flp pilus assembly protein TadB
MPPEIYYKERIAGLQKKLQQLLQKQRLLGWLRFGVVALLIAAIYFLLPAGWQYVTVTTLVLLIVFTRLLFTDLRNKTAIENTRHLVVINEDELKALAHNYYHFADGLEHLPKEHLYANDLDIFGRASLFQYVNRTGSEMGSAVLSSWLLQPADTNTLQQRQTAVKELTVATEWRQQLQAFAKEKKIQTTTQQRLQQWLSKPDQFSGKYWGWLRYILPAILITIIALNIAGIVPYQVRNMALLVFAVIAYFIGKKATPVHRHLSKIVNEVDVLADSIELVENLECKRLYCFYSIERTKKDC